LDRVQLLFQEIASRDLAEFAETFAARAPFEWVALPKLRQRHAVVQSLAKLFIEHPSGTIGLDREPRRWLAPSLLSSGTEIAARTLNEYAAAVLHGAKHPSGHVVTVDFLAPALPHLITLASYHALYEAFEVYGKSYRARFGDIRTGVWRIFVLPAERLSESVRDALIQTLDGCVARAIGVGIVFVHQRGTVGRPQNVEDYINQLIVSPFRPGWQHIVTPETKSLSARLRECWVNSVETGDVDRVVRTRADVKALEEELARLPG
jgi:hypothetical protein